MALLDDAQAILGRAVMPGALDAVTADLNARLRVREMEASMQVPPASVIALPSDFIEAIAVDIDGCPLAPTTTQLLRPGTFAVAGSDMRLVDSGDVLTIDYTARITDPDGAVRTAYPNLYLYGLLAHHATLARDDDGANRWGALYDAALTEANARDARARQSQISMRPVPRYRA